MNVRKIFVDLEMTGLTMRDKLISIGAVTEDGSQAFYAESTDWTKDDIPVINLDWMQTNVIDNLFISDRLRDICRNNDLEDVDVYNIFNNVGNIKCGGNTLSVYWSNVEYYLGSNNYIARRLDSWLRSVKREDDKVLFILDVGHYDFVFLAELFGGAFGLPDYIIPTYHDINYDIAFKKQCKLGEAFDVSREHLAIEMGISLVNMVKQFPVLCDIDQPQHNALYDALLTNKIVTTTR